MLRPSFVALLVIAAVPGSVPPARGASYESLIQQGRFYLSRGPTYGPDALRSLEQARETDPNKADSDSEWLSAVAHAYALTSRFTEALWALEKLQDLGEAASEQEALRDRILSESGLGRVRLVAAVAVPGLVARFEPAAETRLDVTSRKALDKLNDLLAKRVTAEPEGVTLLAPEGLFAFSCSAPSLYAPAEPISLQVWAGDETTVRLIPLFPDPSAWTVTPRSRSIALSWPPLEGASYRLVRNVGEAATTVYQGQRTEFTDAGLPVGTQIVYDLEIASAGGELVAFSRVPADTLPPVSDVRVEAALVSDLRIELAWVLGSGAADRVLVIREDGSGEEILAERAAPDPLSRGTVSDGPFLPKDKASEIGYRVEAWISEEAEAVATAGTTVEIPPLVQRVPVVSESIDRGSVIVVWDTLPREAAAQGYAVYRQRGKGVLGELVGRVEDPFAREFAYEVESPLDASAWRHFVVPYVGDRYLLDPEWLEIRDTEPEEGFRRRKRQGETLPNVGLSWDPYPGARNYVVEIHGREEVLVRKPYVEIQGLQTPLMGTEHRMTLFVEDAQGRRIPLLSLDLLYEHYPRSKGTGTDE